MIYGVFAIWYGLVATLVAVSIILWGLKILSLMLPWLQPHRLRTIAIGAYLITVGYVGLCVYWAHQVKLTRLDVPMPGLNSSWEGKTIAHLSDLHIGGYWDEAFLSKVVKLVSLQQPDLIVITGDLFDGVSSNHRRYVGTLSEFHAPNGVFFISGNHEVYADVDGINKAVAKAGIEVLDDRIVQINGLQLIGVASPPSGKKRQPFDIMSSPNFNPNLPSVLLFHTPTDIKQASSNPTSSTSNSYFAPSTNFRNAITAGTSLQLSGHTHAGQWFPFTEITRRIYNGFHYGLHRINDFHIYINAGTGTWGPPLRSKYKSEIALITLKREIE
jgi:predicted MPP superfamily phosphohydrolase